MLGFIMENAKKSKKSNVIKIIKKIVYFTII